MSLKFKFDENARNKNKQQTDTKEETASYSNPGQVRNLLFVQPDGESMFLNYAYLVSGEFEPKVQKITLSYTTHVVVLNGRNLRDIFQEVFNHSLKQVQAIEERYAGTKGDKESYVTKISIDNIGG